MVFELALLIIEQILQLHPVILLGLIIVGAFVAYKIFAFVFRVLLTGIAFGSFPLIANAVGVHVPLTIESVMWSAFTGIVLLFVYRGIAFGYRILNLAMLPFKKTFEMTKIKRAKKQQHKHYKFYKEHFKEYKDDEFIGKKEKKSKSKK